MKKIIIIIFFLTLSINSYASEKIKYYICSPNPDTWPTPPNVLPPCQGVQVDESTLEVEFFRNITVNNSRKNCSYDKVFKMTSDWNDFYKKSKGYPFTGKWGPRSSVKGVIYDDYPPRASVLVYTIDKDIRIEWPCTKLKP